MPVMSLGDHVPADEEEARDLERIRDFTSHHPNAFDRRIREGHLTGSAIVISAAGDRVVLLHHRKLGRWLQPGGHGNPGEDSGELIALREAREETGIEGLSLHLTAPRPLDVDVHEIPSREDEPAHQHLDLRYLIVAPPQATLRLSTQEAYRVRWFDWAELPVLHLDRGLHRALAKARSYCPGIAVGT